MRENILATLPALLLLLTLMASGSALAADEAFRKTYTSYLAAIESKDYPRAAELARRLEAQLDSKQQPDQRVASWVANRIRRLDAAIGEASGAEAETGSAARE